MEILGFLLLFVAIGIWVELAKIRKALEAAGGSRATRAARTATAAIRE